MKVLIINSVEPYTLGLISLFNQSQIDEELVLPCSSVEISNILCMYFLKHGIEIENIDIGYLESRILDKEKIQVLKDIVSLDSNSVKVIGGSKVSIVNSDNDLSYLNLNCDDLIVVEEGARLGLALTYSLITNRKLLFLGNQVSKEKFFLVTKNTSSYFWMLPNNISLEQFESLNKIKLLNSGVPIGFFFPYGEEESEIFMIKQLVLQIKKNSQKKFFHFLFTNHSPEINITDGNCRYIAGVDTKAQDLREFLEEDSLFKFIDCHSNGIDAFLGNLVICAKLEFSQEAKLKSLPCFFDNTCNRVDKASSSSSLYPLSKISADVLCLSSCYGFLFSKSFVETETSIAYQLAKSTNNGCFITTRGLTDFGCFSGLVFSEAISNGNTLGQAVQEGNEKHYSEIGWYPQMFDLWGDPSISFNTTTRALKKNINYILDDFFNANGFYDYIDSVATPLKGVAVQRNFFQALHYGRCIIRLLEENIKKDNRVIFKKHCDDKRLVEAFCNLNQSINDLEHGAMRINNSPNYYIKGEQREFKVFLSLFKNLTLLHENFMKVFIINPKATIGFNANFFPADRGVHLNKTLCPYCGENSVSRWESEMLDLSGMKRKVEDCINCWSIFEGMHNFSSAKINCSEKIEIGKEIELSVQYFFNLEGVYLSRVCAVLEPFIESVNIDKVHTYKKNILEVEQKMNLIKLNNLKISENFSQGRYLLKVLVMLNEKFTFLYRNVYLFNKV